MNLGFFYARPLDRISRRPEDAPRDGEVVAPPARRCGSGCPAEGPFPAVGLAEARRHRPRVRFGVRPSRSPESRTWKSATGRSLRSEPWSPRPARCRQWPTGLRFRLRRSARAGYEAPVSRCSSTRPCVSAHKPGRSLTGMRAGKSIGSHESSSPCSREVLPSRPHERWKFVAGGQNFIVTREEEASEATVTEISGKRPLAQARPARGARRSIGKTNR
jgi:hypothetical protein